MAVRNLKATVSGITGIKSISLKEGMNQAAVLVEVVATAHTLTIGDTVASIVMGYDDEFSTMMQNGVVKRIVQKRPGQDYTITIKDTLSLAEDYFIASDTPGSPLTVQNMSAEDVVETILNQVGITNYVGDASGFTFGITGPVKINLVGAYNYIENINRICSMITYAQPDGQVRFSTRKPYIVGGDVSEFDFIGGDSGTKLAITYMKSDENIRNRVVVYGKPGVTATATGASAYLPAGYSKSIVVAHELIDTVAEAQRTADINLTLWNRLTETVDLSVAGKPTIRARDIVSVTDTFCGLSSSNLWVVYGAEHLIGRDGYSTRLTLVR